MKLLIQKVMKLKRSQFLYILLLKKVARRIKEEEKEKLKVTWNAAVFRKLLNRKSLK